LGIARYAWGQDYHKVIRKKLKQLLLRLQTLDPRIQGRGFTDSAPLLEKALAVQAGLGWQGKNSLLLTKEYGSYVFLAELLLNVPLVNEVASNDSDTLLPALQIQDTSHCGRCQRCMQACPTEALVAPAVLDANRCIAYWTIESHAEALPTAISEKQSGWVFGCDICQEVCPWNIRFAHPTQEAAFTPRPLIMELDAPTLATMDASTFDAAFTVTPLRRTGLTRLKRNLLSATSVLESTVTDSECISE
jgi:epoxyqueuosine reductase